MKLPSLTELSNYQQHTYGKTATMKTPTPTPNEVVEFKKQHPKGAKRTIYYDGKTIQGEITCYRLNHFWLEYGVYNPVHGFIQYFKD